MKSTFLVASANTIAGQTKVVLKDVNGGDGLNEFRAGSQRGDVVLDFYGDLPKPTPGQTYVLTLEEYVEPDATNENTDSAAVDTIEKPPVSPLSIAFNATVTIAIDENGNPTLNIDAAKAEAPPEETGEITDKKDESQSSTNETSQSVDPGNATSDTSSATDDTNDVTDGQTDTNTQANTGPAAGANDSEAGNTDATNTDNMAGKEIGSVGGGAQVS